jgi:hypothetical protein
MMKLCRRLLLTHQLVDIQHVEQLFNLLPLVVQKPWSCSLRCCAFFNSLFLNKLFKDLLILFYETDMADKPDKPAMDARTDCFAAHNNKLANDLVAAVAATSLQE